MRKSKGFIAELRHRRVFRTGGLYVVGAWVLLQVADLAFESWGLPAEAMRGVWIAAIALFPVALVFGWRYDITTHGIVRTTRDSGHDEMALGRADYAILAALAVIVAISGYVIFEEVADTVAANPGSGDGLDEALSRIDPHSVAVLPFANRSGQQDIAFFADGIHDDLLTMLAHVTSLKIISRTSVLEYRGTTREMRQIAGELGAANILEGGVQAAGDNVRINVQLIDAISDELRWAETYDRRLTVENIFAIQSEIVETILDELAATLTPDQRRRINSQPTDNMEAYRAYVLAKNSLATASIQSLAEAERQFRHALELDADYTQARIGLADTIQRQAATGAISVQEAIDRGWQHIDEAVRVDPGSAYGQAVLGVYENYRDLPGAESRFQRALELNPNHVDALGLFARFLRGKSRHEEALGLMRQALELDPLSVLLFHDLGTSHIALGQFEEGRKSFHRISQINPENPYAVHGTALATIMSGQVVEAGYWSDAAAAMDPADHENPATSAMVYLSADNFDTAARRIDEALKLGPDEPYPLAAQVMYLRMSGQEERALAVARGALAARLDDRWGSDWVFLRTLRDEALRTGDFAEALAWYEQCAPELFGELPSVDSSNIGKAADLAHLLQAAGRDDKARNILELVVTSYDRLYSRGSANWPLGPAKAQALVLLDRSDDALDELERIASDGWRLHWRFNTELNPSYAAIRTNARYRSLVAEIERDIDQQQETFAASSLSNSPRI
jgi:TolB-like protein/Tfp pilus assembly protein PilF